MTTIIPAVHREDQSVLGKHAVVIGGSMAGLLAARVLADYFERVTLVERDSIAGADAPRKGVPQGRHLHGLLARGLSILNQLFPGLEEELVAQGANQADMGSDLLWYHYGGYKVQFESGFKGITMSRPFLEGHVRQRTLALANLVCHEGTDFRGFITTPGGSQVTGVRIRRRHEDAVEEELSADLVVDASGRGSQTPKWLAEAGYGRPEETSVKIDVGYASRLIRLQPGDPLSKKTVMIFPTPPAEKRMGIMAPLEDNRWMVTLSGWAGDHPPADEEGFMAFARSLPTSDIYNSLLRAEPLADVVLYKYPANLRRHYEKMRRFPEGLLVIGDAVCSFNPIYGQGMTSSALQALALAETLHAQAGTLVALPHGFFKRVARVIDMPWAMAAGEDFRYPETEGKKVFGTDLLNWYVVQVHRAAHHDPQVQYAFLHVMNMIAPPTSLFHPKILWRVTKSALARRQSPAGNTPVGSSSAQPLAR